MNSSRAVTRPGVVREAIRKLKLASRTLTNNSRVASSSCSSELNIDDESIISNGTCTSSATIWNDCLSTCLNVVLKAACRRRISLTAEPKASKFDWHVVYFHGLELSDDHEGWNNPPEVEILASFDDNFDPGDLSNAALPYVDVEDHWYDLVNEPRAEIWGWQYSQDEWWPAYCIVIEDDYDDFIWEPYH